MRQIHLTDKQSRTQTFLNTEARAYTYKLWSYAAKRRVTARYKLILHRAKLQE